jgi:hypothetical protein
MDAKTLKVVNDVSKINGAKFIGLVYTAKSTGEVASYVVQIGHSYKNLVERSLKQLDVTYGTDASNCTDVATYEALRELRESLVKTLRGTQDGYTKAGQYETVCNGVEINKADGTLEIRGLVVQKKVITAGVYKTVKSSAKTIAKNKIRKSLPIGKYRSFALDAEAVKSVKIDGELFEF